MELVKPSSKLGEVELVLPPLLARYLYISYNSDATSRDELGGPQEVEPHGPLPSAAGPPQLAEVVSAQQLTRVGALKRVLEIWLRHETELVVGDSIAVLCPNRSDEVQQLLTRLQLSDAEADGWYQLHVTTSEAGSRYVPAHIPRVGQLRRLLTHRLELRHVPKKPLLRALASCTLELSERRRLEELCSRQGADEYMQLVRMAGLTLPELLEAFPSCRPPVSLLLEHLPRLSPRSYSLASCPRLHAGWIRLLVTVVEHPRPGICSSWLDSITAQLQKQAEKGSLEQVAAEPHEAGSDRATLHKKWSSAESTTPGSQEPACDANERSAVDDLAHAVLERLTVSDAPRVWVFPRVPSRFRLPDDPTRPLLMVAAGSGLAPFLAFLQHWQYSGRVSRDAWLVYGCRNAASDLLAASELYSAVEDGRLKRLDVAFSRPDPPGKSRYVQHVLERERLTLAVWLKSGAAIYVCGAPVVATAVKQQILLALQHLHVSAGQPEHGDAECEDAGGQRSVEEVGDATVGASKEGGNIIKFAENAFKKMVKDGFYKVDVW